MDNWILVVFVFSLHLTCPDLPFAFCMMTCVCSTTGSEQYCEFGCVLYMSGDGGDQHFCTTTRLANEPGPLRVAICYCVPWMVLAQINYKVPPSTFVDSPKFCGEIISPWSFWKGCPAVHHAWPFLLRFAREAEFACFVVISSLFIRQVFHYIVFPIFSLKSTAWNCVGHHSSSCHVISLQECIINTYIYIYRNDSNPGSQELGAAFAMCAVWLNKWIVWCDTSPPEVEEHVGRGVQWITQPRGVTWWFDSDYWSLGCEVMSCYLQVITYHQLYRGAAFTVPHENTDPIV